MIGRSTARIESAVDTGAAALFAAAVAYVLHILVAGSAETVGGGGALAFALCFAGLRRIEPEPRHFKVTDFVIQPVATVRPDELVLTDADRCLPPQAGDELVLDDILAEIGPDSRVVRLFDRAAMPTPGQLKARIDRHLDEEAAAPDASPDASQALYDALAELRRSLN